MLSCWEDGSRRIPTPSRDGASDWPRQLTLPEIDLHEVRHGYANAGRDAKSDWKALSRRIDHADAAFTMTQYVQTDPEACRQATTRELRSRPRASDGNPGEIA